MKLSDIRIGVPLLRLETRIFHATPRKPTAFERIVLGMTERFAQNASFNNIPVERLFIDVLCVSDPGPLVTPTLSELMALDVIRCMGDIEALDTLILRDIEITERGQKMIAEFVKNYFPNQNQRHIGRLNQNYQSIFRFLKEFSPRS